MKINKIVTDLRKQLKKQESILKIQQEIIGIEKYNNIVKDPNNYLLKFLNILDRDFKISPSYESVL